jgi:hypothetical protein
MRFIRLPIAQLLFLIVPVVLAACTGGSSTSDGSSGLAVPPQNIMVTRVDPIGDASAAAGTPWDISQIQTTLIEGPFRNEYVKLEVAVTFAQDVSGALPPSGQPLLNNPNRLGVEILVDLDGSSGTGISESVCSSTANTSGIDAFVDAGGYNGRYADGSFPILNTSGIKIDSAQVSISGHTITYLIDLAALGAPGSGIQKTKISVIAFNGSGQDGVETDCAPDAGPMSVSGT